MKYKNYLNKIVVFNLNLILIAWIIVNCFAPSKLSSGGITGVAIIFYHLYKFPIAWGYLLLNLPLIIAGTFIFGKKYCIKTIYSILAISLYTAVISKYFSSGFFINFFEINQAAGAVLGGIVSGISIGTIISIGGSIGGTTILAQIIERFFNIKIGTTLNIIDTAIIIVSGFFINLDSALFTVISLLLCGIVINTIKYRKEDSLIEKVLPIKKIQV